MSNLKPLPLAALLAITASPAAAQTAIQLEEVQVSTVGGKSLETATGPINGYVATKSATGTKTATPLIETPQSISVVSAQAIRDIGAQSVAQATEYSSGVVSQYFGADTRNDWILIRGFPAQVSGYFLDGLQLYSYGFATFRVEPFDLERIEILKGPASVLYGGSSTGGIINAVSKVPPNAPHGSVEAGIDTWGNKYAAFDVGGPVSQAPNNTLFYRVEGMSRGGGTQVDFIQNDRLSIAPSIAWRPDTDTSVTIIGSYQKDRTNGENFLPYVGTVTPAPFGRIPTSQFTSDLGLDTFQRNQALIGYEAEHRFNDVFTARQKLRYSDLKVDYQTLYGNGYVDYPGTTTPNPASAELQRINFVTTPHVTEFALDNELEARFLTGPLSHVALIGLDYKRYTLSDSQGVGFTGTQAPSPLNLLQPNYFTGVTVPTSRYILDYQSQDQVGEYAQDQMKLGNFTLVLSGRHDQLGSLYFDKLAPQDSAQSADGAFTGRAGLIYTTPQGFAPYVSYATSFDPQLGTNAATNSALVPETGQLTEVGAKYQPPGHDFALTGALFDLIENNVPTTDPTNPTNTTQTGQEQSKGYELQAQGHVTPEISVLGSFTGYRIRNTIDVDAADVGKVPVYTPQVIGSLLVDYTFKDGPLRGFGLGAGPRYEGSSYATDTNTYAVPPFIVADLNAHYENGPWRAQVNVVNLLDKTYVAACQTFNTCFYGDRRRALFSLAYRW